MGTFNESVSIFQARFDNYRKNLLESGFDKILESRNRLIEYLAGFGCPAAFIPFERFPEAGMPVSVIAPPYITVGQSYIPISKDKEHSSVSLPFLLPLCGHSAFLFEGGVGATGVPNLFQSIMLRLSLSLPLKLCRFHMVDCDYGRSFSCFNSLKNPKIQKTLYGADQILGLLMKMEDVMREMYSGEMGKYSNLTEYNRNNHESAKPYNFIFIDDFPVSCSYQAIDMIKSMINNGNAISSGIYIFINFSQPDSIPRDFDIAFFKKNCLVIESKENGETVLRESDIFSELPHSNFIDTCIPDRFDEIGARIGAENDCQEESSSVFYDIHESEVWTESSISGIDVPVGTTETSNKAILHFTQQNALNSALVVGSPGFGKSKFLHSLILNAALRYSPDELEMYMLDFSGVEFDIYDRMHLPHAKIIAPESEREFGVNILEEIYNEGIRRERLCRENAVDSIEALRKKNGSMVVPRILVIIDEFHELFIRNDKIASRSGLCINTIIRKYRKFAINLILSSQKAYQVASDISIDEIGTRIAFSCNPRDSVYVGLDNSSLNLPGGTFIYNDAKGAKNSNIKCKTSYIEGESKDDIGDIAKAMNVINGAAGTHEFKSKNTVVFRSKVLPVFNPAALKREDSPKEVRLYFGQSFAIRDSDLYVSINGESNDNVLIIGGEPMIAQEIAMFTMMSAVCAYDNKEKAVFRIFDFIRPDNQLYSHIEACKGLDVDIVFADRTDNVAGILQSVREEVEKRKDNYGNELKDIYLFVYAMELGQAFKPVRGSYGFDRSEAMLLLDDILRDGPLMHVYTVMQIDNYHNLYQAADNILCYFNHRIVLQMNAADSNRIIDSDAASTLYADGCEWTKYRGYYFNQRKNVLNKFRPYDSRISK